MAEEICLFLSLGPEADGVGKCVHSLSMTANERASEVYMFQTESLSL